MLDIAFREDPSRVSNDYALENFATLLKQEKPAKGEVKAKRLLVGWNQDYLLKVLSG